MKINMGKVDRIIRVIVAALFVVLFLTKVISGILGIILLVLAGIFLITSFISFCPLYLPFGLSTLGKKKPEPKKAPHTGSKPVQKPVQKPIQKPVQKKEPIQVKKATQKPQKP
jgi:hypothetical protein